MNRNRKWVKKIASRGIAWIMALLFACNLIYPVTAVEVTESPEVYTTEMKTEEDISKEKKVVENPVSDERTEEKTEEKDEKKDSAEKTDRENEDEKESSDEKTVDENTEEIDDTNEITDTEKKEDIPKVEEADSSETIPEDGIKMKMKLEEPLPDITIKQELMFRASELPTVYSEKYIYNADKTLILKHNEGISSEPVDNSLFNTNTHPLYRWYLGNTGENRCVLKTNNGDSPLYLDITNDGIVLSETPVELCLEQFTENAETYYRFSNIIESNVSEEGSTEEGQTEQEGENGNLQTASPCYLAMTQNGLTISNDPDEVSTHLNVLEELSLPNVSVVIAPTNGQVNKTNSSTGEYTGINVTGTNVQGRKRIVYDLTPTYNTVNGKYEVSVFLPDNAMVHNYTRFNETGTVQSGGNYLSFWNDGSGANHDRPKVELRGWYDIFTKDYYPVTTGGIVVDLDPSVQHVFYADWVVDTSENNENPSATMGDVITPSEANQHITIHMFDYNDLYMANLTEPVFHGVDIEESWNIADTDRLKDMFYFYNQFCGAPESQGANAMLSLGGFYTRVNPGDVDPDDPTKIARQTYDSVWSGSSGDVRQGLFYKHAAEGAKLFDQNAETIGVTYLGQGTGLFYDDGPYVVYDCHEHGCTYNANTGKFTVYEEPFMIAQTDNNKVPQQGQFFPTHTDGYSIYGNLQNLNYWFGMDISMGFTLPYAMGDSRNILSDNTDMRFEFSGDDDICIEIDGVMILDMGGIHNESKGIIDFATGACEIYLSAGNSDYSETPAYTYNLLQDYPELSTSAGAHTFKIWYMERGGGESNFSMRLGLDLGWDPVVARSHMIEVKKTWEGKQDDVYPESVHVAIFDEEGTQISSVQELSLDNNWKAAWYGLEWEEGYEIREVPASPGYIASQSVATAKQTDDIWCELYFDNIENGKEVLIANEDLTYLNGSNGNLPINWGSTEGVLDPSQITSDIKWTIEYVDPDTQTGDEDTSERFYLKYPDGTYAVVPQGGTGAVTFTNTKADASEFVVSKYAARRLSCPDTDSHLTFDSDGHPIMEANPIEAGQSKTYAKMIAYQQETFNKHTFALTNSFATGLVLHKTDNDTNEDIAGAEFTLTKQDTVITPASYEKKSTVANGDTFYLMPDSDPQNDHLTANNPITAVSDGNGGYYLKDKNNKYITISTSGGGTEHPPIVENLSCEGQKMQTYSYNQQEQGEISVIEIKYTMTETELNSTGEINVLTFGQNIAWNSGYLMHVYLNYSNVLWYFMVVSNFREHMVQAPKPSSGVIDFRFEKEGSRMFLNDQEIELDSDQRTRIANIFSLNEIKFGVSDGNSNKWPRGTFDFIKVSDTTPTTSVSFSDTIEDATTFTFDTNGFSDDEFTLALNGSNELGVYKTTSGLPSAFQALHPYLKHPGEEQVISEDTVLEPTDSIGQILIRELEDGHYVLTETDAPDDYIIPSVAAATFDIENGEISNFVSPAGNTTMTEDTVNRQIVFEITNSKEEEEERVYPLINAGRNDLLYLIYAAGIFVILGFCLRKREES